MQVPAECATDKYPVVIDANLTLIFVESVLFFLSISRSPSLNF